MASYDPKEVQACKDLAAGLLLYCDWLFETGDGEDAYRPREIFRVPKLARVFFQEFVTRRNGGAAQRAEVQKELNVIFSTRTRPLQR